MEDNPILEFWNMFMIFLMVIFLILLLAIVIWALGLSLYARNVLINVVFALNDLLIPLL